MLLMEDGSGAQLYDLANDPGEKWNLAGEQPKVVRRLKQELLEWWKAVPATRLADLKGRFKDAADASP